MNFNRDSDPIKSSLSPITDITSKFFQDIDRMNTLGFLITLCACVCAYADTGCFDPPQPLSTPAVSPALTTYSDHQFTLINNCDQTVWVGIFGQILSTGASNNLGGGMVLASGAYTTLPVPLFWQGRVWPRGGCLNQSYFPANRRCDTGDCNSGATQCSASGERPATLAEFTFDGSGGADCYDVSLVDGYNMGVQITPYASNGNLGQTDPEKIPFDCTVSGCSMNLVNQCPTDLRMVEGRGSKACASGCYLYTKVIPGNPPDSNPLYYVKDWDGIYLRDKYCCTGQYTTDSPGSIAAIQDLSPQLQYPNMVKLQCPMAYSFPYDDKTSTWNCLAANSGYTITFCPATIDLNSVQQDFQTSFVASLTNYMQNRVETPDEATRAQLRSSNNPQS